MVDATLDSEIPLQSGKCESIPLLDPIEHGVGGGERVVIVGAGPAGLFAARMLARGGAKVMVVERGQAVGERGQAIGRLLHKKVMDPESNFCFGEGGAGTWSDGKLKTRIGRNSRVVRAVLEALVEHGAKESILVEGAPHLGTNNLQKILKNMRVDLVERGGDLRFGCKMKRILSQNGKVTGVEVQYLNKATEIIHADAVILATGHSARDVYQDLDAQGVLLEAKGFACGFRVEHPQSLINQIQYGDEWGGSVVTGRPTADQANLQRMGGRAHPGTLPVASYRVATDKAFDGTSTRGVYSFCMCPGGQIVPANTEEVGACVNGMSYSRRDSLFANSGLVVTIAPDDQVLRPYQKKHGVLAGIAFQQDMEERAARMGGGEFVVPAQRLTDFCQNRPSTSLPPSSYRLGVLPSSCHLLYPEPITRALQDAISNHFDRQMRGFLCEEGSLHAVETRTSSPVRIVRDKDTLEAVGVKGLFPAGEGAGFAGGIVSAAVDGIMVADAVLESFGRMRQLTKKDGMMGFDY